TLTLLGGSEETLGKRKRTVPSVMPARAAPIVTQPTANQLPNRDRRKKRRDAPPLAGAAGLAAAGFGGVAGAGAAAGGVAGVPGGFWGCSAMSFRSRLGAGDRLGLVATHTL